MKKLVVVTKFDQANGFRLAGINAIGVDHIQDVNQLINSWLANNEEILLALDDSFFVHLDPKLINQIYQSNDMLIVTIPDGPVSGAEATRKGRIFDMIRHATGAQIRFKGETHGNQ
jgi:vacuolar-type H+-ATPase subunit F/Vma7